MNRNTDLERVYADYNATSPVAPKHYDEVIETLKKVDGNPSSIHHFGREAKIAIEGARSHLAKLFGAHTSEVIFTSGATESNNMVIQGVVGRSFSEGKKPRVLVSEADHASVRVPAGLLEERGMCESLQIPVDQDCIVKTDELLEAINENTALVALIFVNNEVGSINPVKEIAQKIKDKNPEVHIHIDGVQAFGKFDLSWVAGSAIDSFGISGHKVGGFKGVGGLYLKKGTKFNVFISGGGQERRRRSGTENIPGIVSLGIRAKEIGANPSWLDHTKKISEALIQRLGDFPGAVIHGTPEKNVSTVVSFHVDGLGGDDIMLNFDLAGIAVSAGSACSAGVSRPSPVIKAMGYSDWVALNSIRASFGCESTLADVDRIMDVLGQVASRNSKTKAAGR